VRVEERDEYGMKKEKSQFPALQAASYCTVDDKTWNKLIKKW